MMQCGPSPDDLWRIERDFVRAAREWPDKVAVETESEEFTFKDLDERSNRLAHRLLAAEVEPGTYVAVASETIEAFVVGSLAAMKIGAAYLPIDLRYSQSRAKAVLENGAASILIAHRSLDATNVPEALPVIWSFDSRADLAAFPSSQPPVRGLDDGPAYLCFTSGSTGKPKGVVIGHQGVEGLIYDPDFVPYRETIGLRRLRPLRLTLRHSRYGVPYCVVVAWYQFHKTQCCRPAR